MTQCEKCGSGDLEICGGILATYRCMKCQHTNKEPGPPCCVCGKESVASSSGPGYRNDYCGEHSMMAIADFAKHVKAGAS